MSPDQSQKCPQKPAVSSSQKKIQPARMVFWLARFIVGRVSDLYAALRSKNVLIGLLGTCLISIGSLSPAYLPSNTPIWKTLKGHNLVGKAPAAISTLLVLSGIAALMHGWLRLRPTAQARNRNELAYFGLKHWAILLIWGLPFLLAPPIFSHDAYSYAAQGWILHNGIDPYYVGPGILPGAFADQVAWVWRFTPAPYGPLSLRISQWLVEICQFDPYWSAVAQRIPAICGVVLIGVLIVRIADRAKVDVAAAAWFATINPLLVIDFIGGAHNDSLMMGLVILGIWLAFKSRSLHKTFSSNFWWILAAVVIGLAASIKQPALMAAVALPLIGKPWRGWQIKQSLISVAKIVVSLAVAIASFALVSLATGLDFGWYNAIDVPGKVITVSPFTMIGQAGQLIVNIWHLDQSGHLITGISRAIGLGFAVVFIIWAGLRKGKADPIWWLAWSYIVVALCSPALHSWYVLWGGLLLPLAKTSPRVMKISIWATTVLLAYAAVNLSWRNNAVSYGVAALVGFWALVVRHHASLKELAPKKRQKRGTSSIK